MPQIGAVKKGFAIGRKGLRNWFIWVACEDCGKERWVALTNKKPKSKYCRVCTMLGQRSWNWKGGRLKTSGGYIKIRIFLNDFFYPMADKEGYILEHRLIMAKHLGRNLHSWEIVHHKNGARGDNGIENLQLVSDDRHKQITILETKITKLEGKLAQQSVQIRLLRWQISTKLPLTGQQSRP